MLELLLASTGKDNPKYPDSGPGPTSLRNYDPTADTGYFGTIALSELFTIEQIEARSVTTLPGSPIARDSTNRWIKMVHKGKILFIPIRAVRTGVSWNNIYAAGFIYGVDGPGLFQAPTGPVNQLRTIVKTDGTGKKFTFLIRAVRGYTTDPFPATLVSNDIYNSEYTQIRERFNAPSNQIGAPSGFNWGYLGAVGVACAMDSSVDGLNTFLLNNNQQYLRRDPFVKTNTQYLNFYPVLELISVEPA